MLILVTRRMSIKERLAKVLASGNRSRAWPDDRLAVTKEAIDAVLIDLQKKARTSETVGRYHPNCFRLYAGLPEDRQLVGICWRNGEVV